MGRKRKHRGASHVGLSRRTMRSKEWKGLSGPAKIFYLHLKARFDGGNNGKIELPYSAMKGTKGCSSKETVAKAINELEKKKWIFKTKKGGLFRSPNLYGITFIYDEYAKQKG